MADAYYIAMVVQDFVFALILFFAFIYSYLILFIHRFRHSNNIFIVNICLSLIAFSIYFINYATMSYFDPGRLYALYMCNALFYAYNLASITTPFSFVTFTIHRYCSIIYYTKPFFKTKWWVIVCITTQRIVELAIGLPYFVTKQPGCINELWMRIYTFIITAFVSLFIDTVFNVLIFKHVRASTRRVQPQTIGAITNGDNNQRPRINRREISLLRQMIFMFCLFITGWTPVYALLVISQYISVESIMIRYFALIDEVAILVIIINFFLSNHEIREYLFNKIRQCVRC